MFRLDKPLSKIVVYLNPKEFKSTWLGNKAIYRTRMALEDQGELYVLAPGVEDFGEDPQIDRLIRKYGYRGKDAVFDAVSRQPDLQDNLSAAAHLIHGSSEGRFRITYAPGKLSAPEVKGVGYDYMPPEEMVDRFKTASLQPGLNTVNGESIYYIDNPALGLWSTKQRFKEF